MTAICVPVPGRLATYAVVLPFVDITLGWVRLDASGQRWIARTCGSTATAARIRSFATQDEAVTWLVEHEPVPRVVSP
jgi:hypothetical protein